LLHPAFFAALAKNAFKPSATSASTINIKCITNVNSMPSAAVFRIPNVFQISASYNFRGNSLFYQVTRTPLVKTAIANISVRAQWRSTSEWENKQSLTTDRGWSFVLSFGHKNIFLQRVQTFTNHTKQ
jgi:hypothetical protein